MVCQVSNWNSLQVFFGVELVIWLHAQKMAGGKCCFHRLWHNSRCASGNRIWLQLCSLSMPKLVQELLVQFLPLLLKKEELYFLSHVGIFIPNIFPFLIYGLFFHPLCPDLQWPFWTKSQIHLPGGKWQPSTSLFNPWLVEEAETLKRWERKWEWCHLVSISGVQSFHLSWVPYNSEYYGKMCLGKVLAGFGSGFFVVYS